MTGYERVYEYLKSLYGLNEPIFLSEVNVPEVSSAALRQQLKKLTTDGKVKRFDTGIYYLPEKSIFRSGSTLSVDEVINKKYLMEGTEQCGYMRGIMFANLLGLTTQMPGMYEIYTNKAMTDYRETKLVNIRVIIKRPYVNKDNATILQFLDLLKEVVDISEVEGEELNSKLIEYMKKKQIKFDDMKPYLSYYPERIFKNMYEVGLLYGVSA